jgi:hypothetical protein
MPQIAYISKKFRGDAEAMIEQVNQIITEYQAQGFALTLRQLYYQFVARGLLKNNPKNYGLLGRVVNEGRLAGLIDWAAIEDRTRWMRVNSHWDSPSDIIRGAADQFAVDMWENQKHRPEVWIEKDALAGVIENVCQKYDVPFFPCRGYVSQSEQWRAGRRMGRHIENDQQPIIFHLGDHDPSGIDMTRDNQERLELFSGGEIIVKRLALNMDQIRKYDPPPNPAKITDTRAAEYIAQYGGESWELDALEPRVIEKLIEDNIKPLIDKDAWFIQSSKQNEGRMLLAKIAEEHEDDNS